MSIFVDLTPCIPLSLKEEGEVINEEGLTPLLNTPCALVFKRGEEIWERGEAPLSPTLPLPLIREGGQGDRSPNKNPEWEVIKQSPYSNYWQADFCYGKLFHHEANVQETFGNIACLPEGGEKSLRIYRSHRGAPGGAVRRIFSWVNIFNWVILL